MEFQPDVRESIAAATQLCAALTDWVSHVLPRAEFVVAQLAAALVRTYEAEGSLYGPASDFENVKRWFEYQGALAEVEVALDERRSDEFWRQGMDELAARFGRRPTA